MTHDIADGNLTVYLTDRIDSKNANAVEGELMELVQEAKA